ncbi:MAG: TIGR02757 family protein [Nitrospirae bacterium]|nr:TIGR02757 family protein [Nitrospirota bacterium]MBF0541950.1 TIGR02757 family protein [Nitrospirota bacterium]
MSDIYKLKTILDTFYKEFDFKGRILEDPIEFPHRYSKNLDIETAGFIASCFAYGRVKAFKIVTQKILEVMGASPFEFLIDFDVKRDLNIFKGIFYRFNSNNDIIGLLYIIHCLLKEFGSIENAFMKFYRGDMYKGQIGFIEYIRGIDVSIVCERTAGLMQFFPSPVQGSSCKRLNMFLRWMVREKDIDFGLWREIPQNELIIPLDTHIARISRCLKLTERLSNDYKTAIEITNNLKKLDPYDPVKYDFALCHHGISGACSVKSTEKMCEGCAINGVR